MYLLHVTLYGPVVTSTCFPLQSGHNIEKVREKMRELMKKIVNIYPASKLLPYILEGLRSKNNRTRIECVDFVEYLIDHNGAEVKFSLSYFCNYSQLRNSYSFLFRLVDR